MSYSFLGHVAKKLELKQPKSNNVKFLQILICSVTETHTFQLGYNKRQGTAKTFVITCYNLEKLINCQL
jgi:hypothetical protein